MNRRAFMILSLVAAIGLKADEKRRKVRGVSLEKFLRNKESIQRNLGGDQLVLVFVFSKECPYCQQEIKDMLSNQKFIDLVSDKYLLVYAEKKDVKKRMDFPYSAVDMVPSFYVARLKDMRLVSGPAKGAVPIEEINVWLERVYEAYRKRALSSES